MAMLGDLGPLPFAVAPAGEAAVTAPADRWLVLIGEVGPVTAIAPGATLASGARPPAILVAAADLDQAAAIRSAAFRQVTDVSALVLTRPASQGDRGQYIAGVVDGRALAKVVLRQATRGLSGPALPGTPGSIPWIVRSCGYYESAALCATPMTFLSRPYPMPACRNDSGLAAHDFAW
jgi:hypothetical protein